MGAAVGVVPTILVGWLRQRAEKQHQLRQLALEIALAEQQKDIEIAKHSEERVPIHPTITYVLPAYTTVKGFMDGSIRVKDISKVYLNLADVVNENQKSSDKYFGPI
tara:strand:- start:19933 stop:20253 length:321 start_codon:yes stop_codon:yes gene_type:complete